MKTSRQHPLFSPIGCVAALVIVVGLGIMVWLTGGAVFSPGPLTAKAAAGLALGGFVSHAEFENDCGQCHAPFRGIEAARCENCHANVADERKTASGLHGGLTGQAVLQCASCHQDHKGREFNPSAVSLVNFDHSVVGFALATHQQTYDGSSLTCQTCHTAEGYSFNQQTCTDCHSQAEASFMSEHVETFGNDCLSCHDGTGNTANFDHDQFFPLEGAHLTVECTACHVNRQFRGAPTECAACHAEPEAHQGLFGTDCAACHTTTAWTPALLPDHTFPLDHGEQGVLACSTCHPATFREYTCYTCHEHQPANIEAKHAEEGIIGERLTQCAACHPNGRKEEGEEENENGGGDLLLSTLTAMMIGAAIWQGAKKYS